MELGPLPTPVDKLLVLTDLHLTRSGQTIIGLDPAARLQVALEAALADHSDASALILMGDLAHTGHQEEYQRLRDILADVPVPVIPMMGNHDDRATFRSVFEDVPVTASGHIQRVLDLPHHRIITLDTLEDASVPDHVGLLCADRLAWLDDALAGARGRMPLVFAHHPPQATGLPYMDIIRLADGGALLERLRGTGAHLFCGHIHRTISGQCQGVPFTMFKSPCHHAPLDLAEINSHASTNEPGAFGLLLATPDGVIAHSEDVGFSKSTHAGYGG